MCSTPFGIRDVFTGWYRIFRARIPRCSTPFGIRDVFTHLVASSTAAWDECSTPFGIRDVFTQERHRLFRGLRVLNAFRHQRCLHKRDRRDGRPRVLVLNTFRHQRCLHGTSPERAPAAKSAQRLSASEMSSLPGLDRLLLLLAVLNAFRHQRCLHVVIKRETDKAYLCSTPFGIRDVFTTAASTQTAPGGCAQRLSASEMSSLRIVSGWNGRSWCSTPFGIRDVFTHWGRSPSSPGRCAQRLSASEMSSRACGPRSGRRTPVLNAFRHQRCLHFSCSSW